MAGKTAALIRDVENHLHLLRKSFADYSEDVRIAVKTKEYDTGVSMAALRKQYGAEGEARAKRIEADAERIWTHNQPEISAAAKEVKDRLKTLSDYVDKKKNNKILPWNSKSVKKASAYVESTTELLNNIPGKMTKLKKEMYEVADSVKYVTDMVTKTDKLGAELQTEAEGQSDD